MASSSQEQEETITLNCEFSVEMALSSQEQDLSIEKETPDLMCNVCSEQFRDPKLLPCGHTYCLRCIEQIVIETKPLPLYVSDVNICTGGVAMTVTCPDCASEHSVPGKGPAAFLTDFAVVRDIEIRTWHICMKQKSSSCGICESVGKTEAFCVDCSAFLCPYCTAAHKRMKTFNGHHVSSPEISTLKFKPKQKVFFCQQHPKVVVNMYCVTCEEMICNECLCKPVRHSAGSVHSLRYHSRHTVHSVTDESLAMYETKVSQLVDRAKRFQRTLEQDLQDATSQKEKLNEHPSQLRKAVNKTVDSWIATLEGTRENALRQIDEKNQESIRVHQEEMESISSRINSITSSLRFAAKALHCDNKSGKYAMISQAKSLLETPLRDCQEVDVPTSCSFYLLKTPRRESNTFSLLISREQNISIGRISKVELGEKSMIEIHFNTKPLEVPTFRIAYKGRKRCYCPLSGTVRINQCSWELVFTPHCIGKYQIEAQVFGEWICSPPFSTSSLSQLKVGDVVRVSPEASDDIIFSTSESFETGLIKVIEYTTSGSGRTLNYCVTILWGYETEEPEEKEMRFSYLMNSYSSFPLELVL